jgi:hypothetical protein
MFHFPAYMRRPGDASFCGEPVHMRRIPDVVRHYKAGLRFIQEAPRLPEKEWPAHDFLPLSPSRDANVEMSDPLGEKTIGKRTGRAQDRRDLSGCCKVIEQLEKIGFPASDRGYSVDKRYRQPAPQFV